MKSLRILLAFGILSFCIGFPIRSAFGAEGDGVLRLVLEPHCADENRTQCPVYPVSDALHLTTDMLKVDDLVDIDVVLENAAGATVESIRSWLTYDPQILEARSVTLTPVIAKPVPGEQAAYPNVRLVKIGGAAGEIQSNRVAIARVTFRVRSGGNATEIAFENFREDGLGQTAVNGTPKLTENTEGLMEPPCIGGILCQKTLTPLLTQAPSILSILLEPQHEAASSTPNAAEPESLVIPIRGTEEQPAASKASTAEQNTASSFGLLQVQNLKITSRDTSIFLGWQPLRSSELAGYNVYFSTVSGKYIQRRTIEKTASSLVLRDLEPDTTYYVAIRAFNKENAESVFSQEVSVRIGSPESASAPLGGKLVESQPVEGNPIQNYGGTEIKGDTGTSDTLVFFLVLSAIIGTSFACHRQYAYLHSA
ncbi:hypothetical protein EXS65_01385 [Candidatus Peribacteria bacterium]|nr:hypothetical protein [Candidatus Peribacteria bacterium]